MTALGQHFTSLLIDSALRSGSSRGADAEHRHATAGRCAAAADAARYTAGALRRNPVGFS